MQTYIALVHKEPNSDFGVSFPDLPGCVTAGKTLDEARAFASEALELHLEASPTTAQHRRQLPRSRPSWPSQRTETRSPS